MRWGGWGGRSASQLDSSGPAPMCRRPLDHGARVLGRLVVGICARREGGSQGAPTPGAIAEAIASIWLFVITPRYQQPAETSPAARPMRQLTPSASPSPPRVLLPA